MKFLCIAAGGNNTLIETTRKRSDDHWSQSHNTLPAPRRRKITHAPAFKEQHFQPFCGNDQSANRESFNFQLSPNYYEPRMPLDLPNEEQQGRHLGHQTEPYRREPTFATPQNVLSIPESSTGPNETRQSPISDPHFSPVAGLAHNNQSNNRIDYRPQAEISGPMYYPPVWNNPMQYPSNSNNPYNPQFQTGDPALDRSISSPQSFNHLPDSIQFNSTYRNLNESIDPQLSLLSTTGPQGSPAHTAPTSGFQISQYNVSFVHPDLSAHPQRSTADHHSIIAAPDLGVPRSSSSDEALQYKMQAAVLTAPAEIQKESQDRAPSRHDDIRVALEASMDEAFPFEGCFVLTPTSTDIRSGKSYASGFPKRTPSKQKPPRKPMKVEERAAVQHNRKNGVCVRCKLYKERCRGGFPCARCCELKLWKQICVTSQLLEKNVFSKGLYQARVQLLVNNVQSWVSEDISPVKNIEVSNGYAPILPLGVHLFVPQDERLLDHILWRGVSKSAFSRLPSTPYGLRLESKELSALDKYIDGHVPILLQELDEIDFGKKVYSRTMNDAYEYTKTYKQGASMLQLAFRIWATQMVFFKRPWRIAPSSTEALGMTSITDETSSLWGVIPLPRLLNQQLDSIIEARLAENEQRLLNELQNTIFARRQKEWFVIFLTTFVYLSAVEKDTWSLETWNLEVVKKNERGPSLSWPLTETPEFFAQKNKFLADVLTAHFRSVTKGNIPFTLDWSTENVRKMAGGHQAAVNYMQTLGADIKKSSSVLKSKLSSNYSREDEKSMDMKFTAQLMVADDTE